MTFRSRPHRLVLLLGIGTLACTFEDGHGFSTVDRASLEARLEPGVARDLGNHTVLTDVGYQVHLDSATLEVDEVALEELVGGGASGGTSFDPANPPPGYSLCHGGHCHADDGRLVEYAEIEAELAGGGARFSPVVTLPVDRGLDWLDGDAIALDE